MPPTGLFGGGGGLFRNPDILNLNLYVYIFVRACRQLLMRRDTPSRSLNPEHWILPPFCNSRGTARSAFSLQTGLVVVIIFAVLATLAEYGGFSATLNP